MIAVPSTAIEKILLSAFSARLAAKIKVLFRGQGLNRQEGFNLCGGGNHLIGGDCLSGILPASYAEH
jgi:hypothetical protein